MTHFCADLDFDNLSKPAPGGWHAACSGNTPLNTLLVSPLISHLESDTPAKTFVWYPSLARSPCLHPTVLHNHSQFLYSQGYLVDWLEDPREALFPLFGQSTTAVHDDLIMGCPINYVPHEWAGACEWDEKADERVVWRGSPTGVQYDEGDNGDNVGWKRAPRTRLVDLVNRVDNAEEEVIVLHPSTGGCVSVPRSAINAGFDVGFVDINHSYDWLQFSNYANHFSESLDNEQAGRYKYVLDVDGNGWSSRFNKLIKTRSVVFKSSVYNEWYVVCSSTSSCVNISLTGSMGVSSLGFITFQSRMTTQIFTTSTPSSGVCR